MTGLFPDLPDDPVLRGEHVAFTGKLSSLSRRDAKRLVTRLGGVPMDEVSSRTTMLVVGAEGFPAASERREGAGERTADAHVAGVARQSSEHGGEPSRADAVREAGTRPCEGASNKLRKAEQLNRLQHARIKIVAEDQFCDLVGLPSSAALKQQFYALRDVLVLYPALREDHLRYLQKWKLLQPVIRTNADRFFTFQDLLLIRHVNGELERGIPLRSVLRAMQAARDGQLALDFRLDATPARVLALPDRQPARRVPAIAEEVSAEEYFRIGSELDDGEPGRQEAAARAYARALEIDPTLVPAIINLANIHYARDELVEAEALYERSIELEADHFEAFFNLGNVHHDLGRLPEAEACYRRALELNDSYADAHFYLAVTLEKQGRSQEAKPHWRAYPRLAPDGDWVELAREFAD